MPGVYALSYVLMRLARMPLPTPQFSVLAPIVMVLAFFVAALGEELGWPRYVIDPMQELWGALVASILLGLVWAAWHIIPLVQAHRSPIWIAWWCLFTGRSVFLSFGCLTTRARACSPRLCSTTLTT